MTETKIVQKSKDTLMTLGLWQTANEYNNIIQR